MTTPPALSRRLAEALAFAVEKHGPQRRKGTQIPYICHPLAVASLVLEDGGDEEEAMAALLHDVVEDCGGRPVLDQIRGRFGLRVAEIVDGCSYSYEIPKPAWRPRKEAYLAHLDSAPEPVLRVSSADKLHNARSLVLDYAACGARLWERFSASGEETLWYYRELVVRFERRRPRSRLTHALAETVDQLDRQCRIHA